MDADLSIVEGPLNSPPCRLLLAPGSDALPAALTDIDIDSAVHLDHRSNTSDLVNQLVAPNQDRTILLRGPCEALAKVVGHITAADPERFTLKDDAFSIAEVGPTGRGVLHVLNWGAPDGHTPPVHGICRVHLLRHGQAMLVEDGGQVWSHHPIGLTPTGRDQAREAARRLSDAPLAAIYSSPLERAAETARYVAAQHQLDIIVDEGLIEIALGEYEGMTLAGVQESGDLRFLPWLEVTFNEHFPHEGFHHPADLEFPGGESILIEHARIRSSFQRIVRHHLGQSIALVSHTWAIQPLLAYLVGADPAEYYRFGLRYATDTVVEVTAGGTGSLLKLNASLGLDEVAGRRLSRKEGK